MGLRSAFLFLCLALTLACSGPADRLGTHQLSGSPVPAAQSPSVEAEPATAANAVAPAGAPVVTVREQVSEKYYLVRGSNSAEVRAALDRSRPLSPDDGARYDAVSQWYLTWAFRYDEREGSCALRSATVEISIVVNLPKLAEPVTLDAEDRARWDAYLGTLIEHEMGHVRLQLDGAHELGRRLEAASPSTDCAALRTALSALGQEALAAIRAADAHFDAETGHGRLSGAVFP